MIGRLNDFIMEMNKLRTAIKVQSVDPKLFIESAKLYNGKFQKLNNIYMTCAH